jgi:hypothetical protein
MLNKISTKPFKISTKPRHLVHSESQDRICNEFPMISLQMIHTSRVSSSQDETLHTIKHPKHTHPYLLSLRTFLNRPFSQIFSYMVVISTFLP